VQKNLFEEVANQLIPSKPSKKTLSKEQKEIQRLQNKEIEIRNAKTGKPLKTFVDEYYERICDDFPFSF